jgi:hypothetical protein
MIHDKRKIMATTQVCRSAQAQKVRRDRHGGATSAKTARTVPAVPQAPEP